MKATLVPFSLGLLAALAVGCGREHKPCEGIIAKMKDEKIYSQLVTWVDSNISPSKLGKERLQLEVGTTKEPSVYIAKIDFDWRLLDIPPSANQKVCILCDEKGDWEGVWLGNLRFAVIVGVKPLEPALQWNDIVYRDRRVAVWCPKE